MFIVKKEKVTPIEKPEKASKTKKVEGVKPVKKAGRPAKKVEVAHEEKVKAEAVVTPEVNEVVTPEVKSSPVQEVKAEKKGFTLNQEFNILIGFFSIAILVVLCTKFQSGSASMSGWEILLNSNAYSGVFKGLMIVYIISLFIDCGLAVRVESENKIFNTVEKILYAVTLTSNLIAGAILFTLIKKIGLGLIIFGILSIVSMLIKLARIYCKN